MLFVLLVSQELCHFDKNVLMEAFHGVHYVQALPAVEIPTGSAGTAQVPFQKSTQISISAEKQINNNTHAAPNTPDKPIETKTSYADYPLPLTKSALMHVSSYLPQKHRE